MPNYALLLQLLLLFTKILRKILENLCVRYWSKNPCIFLDFIIANSVFVVDFYACMIVNLAAVFSRAAIIQRMVCALARCTVIFSVEVVTTGRTPTVRLLQRQQWCGRRAAAAAARAPHHRDAASTTRVSRNFDASRLRNIDQHQRHSAP